jgi:hypothetical protein
MWQRGFHMRVRLKQGKKNGCGDKKPEDSFTKPLSWYWACLGQRAMLRTRGRERKIYWSCPLSMIIFTGSQIAPGMGSHKLCRGVLQAL